VVIPVMTQHYAMLQRNCSIPASRAASGWSTQLLTYRCGAANRRSSSAAKRSIINHGVGAGPAGIQRIAVGATVEPVAPCSLSGCMMNPGKLALARCKLHRDPLFDEKRLVTAVG
jgi:hypothetical protein